MEYILALGQKIIDILLGYSFETTFKKFKIRINEVVKKIIFVILLIVSMIFMCVSIKNANLSIEQLLDKKFKEQEDRQINKEPSMQKQRNKYESGRIA